MAKIRVRALKDGHYGGYYRNGPIENEQGITPGEVFEVEETAHPMIDPETKKPVQMTDEKGKLVFKTDKATGKIVKDAEGNPTPVYRMIHGFSKEWMERVPDETPITFDYEPFQVPIQYREKKQSASGVKAKVPQEALRALDSVI